MGLRDEALLGAKYHSFESSPTADFSGKASMFFAPDGGATITGIYEDGSSVNVIDNYTNSSVIPAGTTIAAREGTVFSRITGTTGGINYVNG